MMMRNNRFSRGHRMSLSDSNAVGGEVVCRAVLDRVEAVSIAVHLALAYGQEVARLGVEDEQ